MSDDIKIIEKMEEEEIRSTRKSKPNSSTRFSTKKKLSIAAAMLGIVLLIMLCIVIAELVKSKEQHTCKNK